jgi:hypothetical protein
MQHGTEGVMSLTKGNFKSQSPMGQLCSKCGKPTRRATAHIAQGRGLLFTNHTFHRPTIRVTYSEGKFCAHALFSTNFSSIPVKVTHLSCYNEVARTNTSTKLRMAHEEMKKAARQAKDECVLNLVTEQYNVLL